MVTWNPDEKMRKKKRQTIGNNLNNDKTKKVKLVKLTKREVVQCILDIPPEDNM